MYAIRSYYGIDLPPRLVPLVELESQLLWLPAICAQPLVCGAQIALARHQSLRRRRSVAERTVRSDGVVMAPPPLDQHLGFLQAIEDLAIEQLVPELAIEALVVSYNFV